MDERLTEAQLQRVVAEVQRLSERRRAEPDIQEVKDILRQIDLSPELFDDAMAQIKRQDDLQKQQRHRRWLVAGVSVVVMLGLASWLWLGRRQEERFALVMAQSDRMTRSPDDGGNLSRIQPQAGGSELVYRLTLADAPVGEQLALTCRWTNPSGQVVHVNQYQTKTITTPVWPTFCRYSLGPGSPQGAWKVASFLGDRQLSTTSFRVE